MQHLDRDRALKLRVVEHVEGKPLSELIPSDGLPPESVIRYGTQIADALAHAHEHGVVHRDLKSANVVITPDGRAKVLDFGVADKLPDPDAEALTQTHDGSIRASGSNLRASAQLFDGTTVTSLWAERYGRGLAEAKLLRTR